MPWSVYNSNGKLLQSLAIGDDSIVEGKLDVSNAPTNGYFLQAQSGEGGGLTWAAASSGPSQAVQADLQSETNEDTYAAPDLIKYSPGVAKVWVKMNSAGSNIVSHNVYATGQDSTGTFAVTIAIDFSSNSYVGLAQGEGGGNYPASIGNLVAGSYKVYTFSGASLSNNTNDSAAWGTQV